jgi:putative lipoprotein
MKILALNPTVIFGSFFAFLGMAQAEPVKEFKVIGGKEWTLTTLKQDGKPVALAAKKPITLKLDKGGKASGKSAVNRYFGKVELDGKGGCTWQKAMGATRMAGPPEMMEIERSYFQALPKTTAVDLSEGVLTFSTKDRKTSAVFGNKASTATSNVVEGQVVYKADPAATIPAGTKVTVSLQDVSLADAAAITLGKVVIDDAKEFPVKFKVPYEPESITKGRRYSISARIADDKGLRYINDTAHPVFKDGKAPAKPMDLLVIKVK